MSTITVAPTVELGSTPPRVRLDVTDTGAPEVFSVTVTRHDPDGRTVPVRTSDGNPVTLSTSGSTRVGVAYDYEAPYGQAVTYSTEEDSATVSAQVVVDETRVWLTHPGVPVLSIPLTVGSLGSRAHQSPRGVFYPLGRRNPVVQTDGQRKSAEYTLELVTVSELERVALHTICDDASVLLLNVPADKGWGMSAEYVSVGDLTEARAATYPGYAMRRFTMSVTVVDRPVGGSQAARSYADILSLYGSYDDVLRAYDTYFDLLAGP